MAGETTSRSTPLGDDQVERWWRDHAKTVYRLAVRRLGPSRAEDICAQTFVVAWQSRETFDPTRSALPWLIGIATNLIRRELRSEERALRAYARTGVDPVQTEDLSDLVERLDAAAAWPEVARALSELGTIDREILWLTVVGTLTYVEVAEVLGVPIGTVRSRLSRARTRLQNAVLVPGPRDGGDLS